ncbi:hypothetical protein F5Y14DRAFT_439039 [Nemania sp. NC0429]|nr:hypothetical protein F5Y14DRAFT_439039 [Nemania sp. NC0429]
MAEALGVAASGIAVFQVATLVGKSIIKLKQLWDDLQDVPSSIRDLLDQIECLDPALWEAEHTFDHASLPPMIWDNSIASRSTAYCRKALNSLSELVDELALQINRPGKLRSKVAAGKVVLKKEQLKSLERRLQNAVMMLTLAQQSYLVALTSIQPHIIMQGFKGIITPLTTQALQNHLQLDQLADSDTHGHRLPPQAVEPADDLETENRLRPRRRTPKRYETVRAIRFQLPTWLCQTTWELQSSRSYGNWKLNLRYYSVVPFGGEVFRIAEWGTVHQLEMLVASGQASPYDRDAHFGFTLLHYALIGLNKPMARYLLDIGLSPSEGKDWFSMEELEEICDSSSYTFNLDGKMCTCNYGLASGDILSVVQHLECPQHEATTLVSRLKQLWQWDFYIRDPKVISDILQPYWSEDISALCTASMVTGFPLIHIIAKAMTYPGRRLMTEWAALAGTVLANTSNIHAPLGPEIATPLTTLVDKSINRRPGGDWGHVHFCLMQWLSKVQSSGYDLEEYGRRENELLTDKDLKVSRYCGFSRFHKKEKVRVHHVVCLRGYEYGPEPEDWRILWTVAEKRYAADFWRLVEDGPQSVPGAWVEDDDDEEDDYIFSGWDPKYLGPILWL